MNTSHRTILVLITWIAVLSLRIDAYLYCPPKSPVEDKCRKTHERYGRPIDYRVCGSFLVTAFNAACFPSDVRIKRKGNTLKKQKKLDPCDNNVIFNSQKPVCLHRWKKSIFASMETFKLKSFNFTENSANLITLLATND